VPGYTKLIFLTAKAVRRLPPEQRRQVMGFASTQARRHGPAIARHVRTAVESARRPR
jgi:hypothetical protein